MAKGLAESIDSAGLGNEAFLEVTDDKARLFVRRGSETVHVTFDTGDSGDAHPRAELEGPARALVDLFAQGLAE